MASEKEISELLDLVTSPNAVREGPESLRRTPGLHQLRRATRQQNVVGIGVAAKVTSGRTLSELGLTYYVMKKLALARLSGEDAVPPVVIGPHGSAIPTDVVAIGLIRPEANVRHTPIAPG